MTDDNKPLRERFPNSPYHFGVESYGGVSVFAWDNKAGLSIGNYCSFAFGSKILLGGNHRTDWVTTFPFSARWPEAEQIEGHPVNNGPVSIENDVWVGAEAMILSGANIGNGAVIGARSLVTAGRIPEYAIAVGAPAKVIGYRFPLGHITRLVKTAWWDWPRERIVKALPLLLAPDIGAFLDAAERGEA